MVKIIDMIKKLEKRRRGIWVDKTSHNPGLTSAEIANLWSQYMNDSLAACMIRYFLEKVEDKDIRSVLEFALELSNTQIEKIK